MTYLTNKYTVWYYQIIHCAQKRDVMSEYTEKHHIIPKALGGTNSRENLVCLTAREHFVCHRLLTKMVTGSDKIKMLCAVWAFTRSSENQSREKINSRTYEIIRSQLALALSLERKGKLNKGKIPWNKGLKNIKGTKHSDKTRAKMKESWKSRPARTKEHCTAISQALKGKPLSEETKRKMSEMRKGKIPIQTLLPFTCEYCNKTGVGSGNYKRWHGKNCKEYK